MKILVLAVGAARKKPNAEFTSSMAAQCGKENGHERDRH